MRKAAHLKIMYKDALDFPPFLARLGARTVYQLIVLGITALFCTTKQYIGASLE